MMLCQTSTVADFARVSRIVGVEELEPSLLNAVRATLARHELDIVLLDVVSACQTESTPRKRRWLVGPRRRAHTTAIVLTSTWLVWATDASGQAVVSMCRITDGEVRRFSSPGSDDTGLEVTCFLEPTATQRGTAFIPVDGSRAGIEFAQLVLDTASAAGR
jgi:hypothetical protein